MARILRALEKDILTEIGSMCAGNATTALAQILGRRVELQFPHVKLVTFNKLPLDLSSYPEEVVMGIHMQILGEMHGNALLVFPRRTAFSLIDVLIGPLEEDENSPTELGISAIKEMGNVVISSYLSTLTAFTGISAFSSTVNLINGSAKYLAHLAFFGLGKDERHETLLIEALFKELKKDISGNFFIVFDIASMNALLKKSLQMLKSKRMF